MGLAVFDCGNGSGRHCDGHIRTGRLSKWVVGEQCFNFSFGFLRRMTSTSQVSDEFASRMQWYRNGGQSAYEADIGSYDTFIIGKATVEIPKGYSYITSGDLYVAQDASVSDGFPALEFQFYAGGEDECILLLNYYASTMLKNDEPRMIQPLTQADVNGKTVYGKGYTFTRGSSEYTFFIYTYHVGSTNVMTATVEKGENSDQVNLYAIHFIGSLEIADE